jgi:hypothetical protein
VTCRALPGLVSESDMLVGARQRTARAIRCYLESLRKDGLPVPPGEVHDAERIRESVTVVLERRVSRRLPALKPRRVNRASEHADFLHARSCGGSYTARVQPSYRLHFWLNYPTGS